MLAPLSNSIYYLWQFPQVIFFPETSCHAHWGSRFWWRGENHFCPIDAAKFCLRDSFQSQSSQNLFKGFQFQEVDQRQGVFHKWRTWTHESLLGGKNSMHAELWDWPQILFESSLFELQTSQLHRHSSTSLKFIARTCGCHSQMMMRSSQFLDFFWFLCTLKNRPYFVRYLLRALLWLMWALIWHAKSQARRRHSAAKHGIEGC